MIIIMSQKYKLNFLQDQSMTYPQHINSPPESGFAPLSTSKCMLAW